MKTFEFKSQICTTKEQSERLLALGLKKETADMMYVSTGATCMGRPIPEEYRHYEPILSPYAPPFGKYAIHIPAWSLHRLMELLPKELKIDDKRLEFFITYDMDVMLVDERNEEYLTFFADNLYDSLISYAEWILKTFNGIEL